MPGCSGVRRLKAFVRKAAPQRVPVDPNAIVHEALRFLAADVRSKHVAVRLDLAENLPKVQVDPLQIEQVLLNLIRNAVDAMEATPTDQRAVDSYACRPAWDGLRRHSRYGVRADAGGRRTGL